MSKQSILIIRPVMNSYNDYGRELYEVLSFSMGSYIKWESLKVGYKIIDLAGREATRDAFESAIKLYEDIDIVVFLGHGNSSRDALSREENGKINGKIVNIVDTENIYLCKGKRVYVTCCHSAEQLGPEAVSKGIKFYMGFVGKFLLVTYGIEYIVSYCSIFGLIQLLNGACPVQAWTRMQFEHKYWIDKLEEEQEKLDPNWFLASAVLKSNMANSKLCI